MTAGQPANVIITPLDAAIVLAILALPPLVLVLRQLRRLEDPVYLRRRPVVVECHGVLEERSAPIGEYLGQPIAGAVVFRGLRYRFDHVLDRRNLARMGPGQLFVEPGLVYIFEDAGSS